MTESDLIIESIINQLENQTLNEMAQWRQDKDFLTGWITPAEANDFIRNSIESGEYQRGEIKKSSMRWADPSDHSKGYLCRVVLAGEKASPKREYSARTLKRRGIAPEPDAKPDIIIEPSRNKSSVDADTLANAIEGVIDRLYSAISSRKYIKDLHGDGYSPAWGKRSEWIADMTDGWCFKQIGLACGKSGAEAYKFGNNVIHGNGSMVSPETLDAIQDYREQLDRAMARYCRRFEYDGPTLDWWDD